MAAERERAALRVETGAQRRGLRVSAPVVVSPEPIVAVRFREVDALIQGIAGVRCFWLDREVRCMSEGRKYGQLLCRLGDEEAQAEAESFCTGWVSG